MNEVSSLMGSENGETERSMQRRLRIAEGAIKVLATHGVAGLTHRLVAREASVSLAATTYYFDTKFDMIATAAAVSLHGYSQAFRRVVERAAAHPEQRLLLGNLAARLVRNASERDRIRSTGWTEIMLDASRHPDTLMLAVNWFSQVYNNWEQIARLSGEEHARESARSAIDIVIGLILMALSLGLTGGQVDRVLLGGADPMKTWKVRGSVADDETPRRGTRKSQKTRDKIIAAAIEILIRQGPAAVNYRSVAAAAEITTAGPYYHFPTTASLIAAAQEQLFEEAKARYRSVAGGASATAEDLGRLIDRTATVFLREATEFGGRNLASYTVWLQAARQPELRSMIWSAVEDQYLAWKRLIDRLSSRARPLDPLLAQALFIGKLIRVVSIGSPLEELQEVRREFAGDLDRLLKGNFWI